MTRDTGVLYVSSNLYRQVFVEIIPWSLRVICYWCESLSDLVSSSACVQYVCRPSGIHMISLQALYFVNPFLMPSSALSTLSSSKPKCPSYRPCSAPSPLWFARALIRSRPSFPRPNLAWSSGSDSMLVRIFYRSKGARQYNAIVEFQMRRTSSRDRKRP